MLDSPVSGGPRGAATRKLALWVGGDKGAFERIQLGLAKIVTDTVMQVTGRPARTFQQFLDEDPTFAPLLERIVEVVREWMAALR